MLLNRYSFDPTLSESDPALTGVAVTITDAVDGENAVAGFDAI